MKDSNISRVRLGNSISTQLLTKVFSLYVLIALSVTLVHMGAEYYNTKDSIRQDLRVFQTTFEKGLALGLFNIR